MKPWHMTVGLAIVFTLGISSATLILLIGPGSQPLLAVPGSRPAGTVPIRTYTAGLKDATISPPAVLWVDCQLDDWFGWNDRTLNYSIAMTDAEDQRSRLHGFVGRNNATGQSLFDILKDGKKHRLAVEVQDGAAVGGVAIVNIK